MRFERSVLGAIASGIVLIVTGCGPKESPPTMLPTSTPTRTGTSTATGVPTATGTATPTPTVFPPHVEVVVGSTAEGSGALATHKEFEGDIPLYLTQCFNGQGDDCEGGTALYSAGSPGVEGLEENDPEESLFVLDDDTPITLEVVAIAGGLSFMSGADRLDAPGQSALIGTTPELHADLDTQLIRPGGDLTPVEVTFKLTTTRTPPYAASDPFMIRFVPVLSSPPDGADDGD